MLTFTRSLLCSGSAALLSTLLFLPACDDADASPDPLAEAQVVRCEMSEDKVCIEYQRVKSGNTAAFVALDEAREICRAGWTGDSTKPGTFEQGPCPTDAALARCNISRRYLEFNYYNEGFADTATLDDPLVPLTTLCKNSLGTLEVPPF
jgi:hypothetical protein